MPRFGPIKRMDLIYYLRQVLPTTLKLDIISDAMAAGEGYCVFSQSGNQQQDANDGCGYSYDQ